MTSDALIEMIERKLEDYGLEKVIPLTNLRDTPTPSCNSPD
jgi:hypothetical protein